MRVRHGDRTLLEARANAEAIADALTPDYYAQLPQIRLTRDPTSRPAEPGVGTEVILEAADIARLLACAVRHPNPNMRGIVAAAIWNEPEMFRKVFEFGLTASPAFAEIRKIVAEALAKLAPAAAAPGEAGRKALLPSMPLPPHLKERGRGE